VITGGAGGLGSSMAAEFIAQGANVVLADLDQSALGTIKAILPNERVKVCVADVTLEGDNQRLIEFAEESFGGIDVFVADAGTEGSIGPIVSQKVAEFDRVMAMDVLRKTDKLTED